MIEVRVSSIEERTAIREAIISGSFSLFFCNESLYVSSILRLTIFLAVGKLINIAP
jgi:hypothetical protein